MFKSKSILSLLLALSLTSSVYASDWEFIDFSDMETYIQESNAIWDMAIPNRYKDNPIDIQNHKYKDSIDKLYDLDLWNTDVTNRVYPDKHISLNDFYRLLAYFYDINGVVGVLNPVIEQEYGFDIANLKANGVEVELSKLNNSVSRDKAISLLEYVLTDLGIERSNLMYNLTPTPMLTLGEASYLISLYVD